MFQSKGRTRRTLLNALVAVLTISILAGCGTKGTTAGGNDTSKVIATYEGGQVTANEYDREQRIVLALQPQMEQFMQLDDFRDYLVKQVIAYKYLESKADEKTKESGKAKAEEQFSALKKAMGDEGFKQMLDSQKLTEQEFKDYMIRVFIVMESGQNQVTDEEVKKEFEATKDSYTTASVRHILIGFTDKNGNTRTPEEALKLAKEVKAKLDKGEDFATLVKQYSDDGAPNIENGGLYADTQVSMWVEAFKQAALTQPLNVIGEPVETEYGYHIVRVEARNEKTFEDLTQEQKDMIKTTLASMNLDAFIAGDLVDKVIKSIDLPKVETEAPEAGTNNGTDGTTNGSGSTSESTDSSGNTGTSGK